MDSIELFGKNAGKVWKALSNAGPRTLTQIQKVSGLTLKEAGMGLGWLAKEGKIKTTNADGLHPKFELCE